MFNNIRKALKAADKIIDMGPKLIVAIHTSLSVFEVEAVYKDCGLVCKNPYYSSKSEILILNDDGTIVGPRWCKKWYPISGFKEEVK